MRARKTPRRTFQDLFFVGGNPIISAGRLGVRRRLAIHPARWLAPRGGQIPAFGIPERFPILRPHRSFPSFVVVLPAGPVAGGRGPWSGVAVADKECHQLAAGAFPILTANREHVAPSAAQFPDHALGYRFAAVNAAKEFVFRTKAAGVAGVKLLVDFHGCFLWLVSNRLTPILREPVEKVQGRLKKFRKWWELRGLRPFSFPVAGGILLESLGLGAANVPGFPGGV